MDRKVNGEEDEEFQVVRRYETVEQRKVTDQSLTPIFKQIKKKCYTVEQQVQKKIRENFKQQKFKEVLELAKKHPYLLKEYQQIKYHDEVFDLQQDVLINNASNPHEDYIGKIDKIYRILESKTQTFILLLAIKWFYRRDEILKHLPQHKNWISQQELFTTQDTDIIQSTAINGSCIILSLDEYESLPQLDKTVFYSRLGWQSRRFKFEGFELLKKICVCRQPVNPDLSYIQCDKCKEWYHMDCVGVQPGEYESKDYLCQLCS